MPNIGIKLFTHLSQPEVMTSKPEYKIAQPVGASVC